MAMNDKRKMLTIEEKVKALVTCELAVYGKLTKKTFQISDDLGEIQHTNEVGDRYVLEIFPPAKNNQQEYSYAVYPVRRCVKSGYLRLNEDTLPRVAKAN